MANGIGSGKSRQLTRSSSEIALLTSTSNLSNVASLLWHAYASLPAPSSSVNWTGFYIRDDKFPTLASPISSPPLPGAPAAVIISTTYTTSENQVLLLGPFQGKPACQEIRFGKGVCGTAAAKQETVVVPDVLEFPGHIACDAESRSEIVVPILVNGEVSTMFTCHRELQLTRGRPSLLSTSTAPSPPVSTTKTRNTSSNWLPSWLRVAIGKGIYNNNGYERHGLVNGIWKHIWWLLGHFAQKFRLFFLHRSLLLPQALVYVFLYTYNFYRFKE